MIARFGRTAVCDYEGVFDMAKVCPKLARVLGEIESIATALCYSDNLYYKPTYEHECYICQTKLPHEQWYQPRPVLTYNSTICTYSVHSSHLVSEIQDFATLSTLTKRT